MAIDFEHCSIVSSPFTFIDKKDTAVLIRALTEPQHAQLTSFYLHSVPRNCFNCLPPIRDDTCLRWVENTIASAFNLVALSFDHGIVGHACLFPVKGETGELLVVVSPGSRDRGIGSQLIRCIVQVAFEAGFDKLWLSVEVANRVARHVYNKCGFEYLTMSQMDEVEMALNLGQYRHRTKIRIGELMNKNVVSISQFASCKEAISAILTSHVCALPVIDESNRLLGVISETDLIMEVNLTQHVSEIMTRGVIAIRDTCPVSKAIRIFQSKKVRILPVTDQTGKLIGVVGRKSILSYYYQTL